MQKSGFWKKASGFCLKLEPCCSKMLFRRVEKRTMRLRIWCLQEEVATIEAPSSFGWNVRDVNHSRLMILQYLHSCGALKTSKKSADTLSRKHMDSTTCNNLSLFYKLEPWTFFKKIHWRIYKEHTVFSCKIVTKEKAFVFKKMFLPCTKEKVILFLSVNKKIDISRTEISALFQKYMVISYFYSLQITATSGQFISE